MKPKIEELYKAAIDTHKHYDTVSLTIIVGIIGIAAGSIPLYKAEPIPRLSGFVFLIGVFLDLGLLWLYWRCSELALVARNVSTAIEKGKPIGVSTVFGTMALRKKFAPNPSQWQWAGIRATVLVLSVLLIVVNFILFRETVTVDTSILREGCAHSRTGHHGR